MTFSLQTRRNTITQLKRTDLDVLIIGGGITGAGAALQSIASGAKTGLIDMGDFGSGTSSRSTKLVHGGIRYLKTFDVTVVADTVQERARIANVAPHIPHPAPMLMPIYQEPGATFDLFAAELAMDLYDRLANIQQGQYAHYMLDREAVLARIPNLAEQHLIGGGVYLDYINNDARLVIENIKEADELGAMVASHLEALEVIHADNGKAIGVKVHDHLSGEVFTIHAKILLNTTGPWADDLRHSEDQPLLRPTKGVHLVVDDSVLFVPQPIYFDSGLQDGRMIFVIPRAGKTYFGTTDTDYQGDLKHPTVAIDDVDYLLNVINIRFPEAQVSLSNIEASWAGLRPLLAPPTSNTHVDLQPLVDLIHQFEAGATTQSQVEALIADLAKKHAAPSTVSRGYEVISEPDGMLTIAGGKLTDYRKMAESAITVIRERLLTEHGVHTSQIDSTHLQVSGGHFDPSTVLDSLDYFARLAEDAGIPRTQAHQLAQRFGSNIGRVLRYAQSGAAPGLSLGETASLRYSVFEEMALTPVDYMLRRTNLILFHADTAENIAGPVVAEMARLLEWDDLETEAQLQRLLNVMSESALTTLKREHQ
ncbi:FAD-dependent oxidoreductase [Lacticaseibacillus porcinae]|uniref:FAD-dependent oxidoreductase n=1 Tax=Lacticaseibacillus porcinae TaxID=1123687 RepID=UPI000F768A4F|nr:FAD-dependent oxidoreductase [Lacticaseibacillus porcinae]